MAVKILHRTPVQSIAPVQPVEELSDREKNALVEAGILPATSAPVSKTKQVNSLNVQLGTRVAVATDLYHWVKYFQKGDTGVIVRLWPPSPERSGTKAKYALGLVEVKMDNPRVNWRDKVIFDCADLELVL